MPIMQDKKEKEWGKNRKRDEKVKKEPNYGEKSQGMEKKQKKSEKMLKENGNGNKNEGKCRTKESKVEKKRK